jgi:hypothetical protein
MLSWIFTFILTKEKTILPVSDVTRQSIASYKILRLCAEAVHDKDITLNICNGLNYSVY